MADIWDKIIKALAAAGGAVLGLLGGWSPILTALAVFMGLDYITGVIVAVRGKSQKTDTGGLSSKVGFEGLLRKAMIMVVVLMGAILDHALGSSTAIFCTAAAAYFVANEGISILENVALMGVPVPAAIQKALEMISKKSEVTDEDKDE